MEAIEFIADDGTIIKFYIEEQTRVNGVNYLLVTADTDDEEAEALILKDISPDSSEEADYVPVEDETELRALLKVFEETMEDTEIRM
ncbi:MAG: DUF1292 domain-containing protein [Lachnospiraceae bacterium]|nr:DUF1292 domain-containing protein [Lachnospiraceae bacterium]